mgnify:FL=1|jgi:hypothetical protein
MTTIQEVKNNVDVDEEMNKDLLLRQSRLLYPEVEDWVLNMAIEAYVSELKREPLKMQEIN